MSEQAKKKTKFTIRLQYHEDYLNMEFYCFGNVYDSYLWCFICGKKLSNGLMIPNEQKRNFFTIHSHLVDKNALYYQRLLKSENKQLEKLKKIYS